MSNDTEGLEDTLEDLLDKKIEKIELLKGISQIYTFRVEHENTQNEGDYIYAIVTSEDEAQRDRIA